MRNPLKRKQPVEPPENETYPERRERERAERTAQIKRDARKRRRAAALRKAAFVLGGTAVAAASLVVGTLIFQAVIWNLGVVGLLTALGASASEIGFGTAFGGLVLILWIAQLAHETPFKINASIER